jgi:hypothetical protein
MDSINDMFQIGHGHLHHFRNAVGSEG